PSELAFRRKIADLPSAAILLAGTTWESLYRGALSSNSGRGALYPGAVDIEPLPASPPTLPVAGNLDGWTATATGKWVILDPERGRFKVLTGPPDDVLKVSYVYA